MATRGIGEYVIVQPVVQDETEGGIILPKSREPERPSKGRLIAVANKLFEKYPELTNAVGKDVYYDGTFNTYKVGEELAVNVENIVAYAVD